jgi:hypothetical protein
VKQVRRRRPAARLAGVIPLQLVAGEPIAEEDVPADVALPGYPAAYPGSRRQQTLATTVPVPGRRASVLTTTRWSVSPEIVEPVLVIELDAITAM